MLRSLYTAATGMVSPARPSWTSSLNNLDQRGALTRTSEKTRSIFRISCQKPFAQPRSPMRRGGSQPRPAGGSGACALGLHIALLRPGDMIATKNPLDLPRGSGFFRIQRANGDIAFTRDGSFRLDATGRMSPVGAKCWSRHHHSHRCDQRPP